MTFDPHTSRLRFDGTINMATVITIASMAVAGVWYASRLSQAQDSLAALLNSRIEAATVREADQEGRLRSLEIQQTRSDEKFNAILDALRRLETQLEEPRP